MGIISGRDSKCQVGLESTWGTPVSTTVQLPFTSESLGYTPSYQEEDALVGSKTSRRMDIMSVKTAGDVSLLVKPDAIGELLAATLGEESSSETASGVFEHVFTPVAGGTNASLLGITVCVDRKVNVFQYISQKVNELSLEGEAQDYLRASVSLIGYDEAVKASMASVSGSTLKAMKFSDGAVTIDGSSFADITSFSLNYGNNLDDDLFTINSGQNMVEPQPQSREITGQMEVLYSEEADNLRSSKFKAGDTMSAVLTFTSEDEIVTGENYKLEIVMPLCYITDAPVNVDGPDRIKQTLSFTATESETQEAITVTLTNDRATAYIA
ncbi:MAG: hypothetical protein K9L57_10275 [Spirochaetaceae bacterium]|nr:hypothetical protein [Spirochaetaceae bacterium]